MKEIIYNITQASAGRTITLTGLTEELGADNVLGIINKTQSKVLYTPMQIANLSSVTYSNGTLTIVLASSVPQIAASDKLFIKLYSPSDPSDDAQKLAEFFGVTVLQGYEFMTDTEVTDELEDIMQALDPELTAEQAASITAEAMQIINPSQS